MRSPDNGLRPLLRQYMREGIAWTTIETGRAQAGVPDSNYLFKDGVEGWVECKATRANKVTFESEQIGWLHRRARYGGRAYIAIRKAHAGGRRLGVSVDELWLCSAKHVVELSERGLDCGFAECLGEDGPARWNWPAVRAALHL